MEISVNQASTQQESETGTTMGSNLAGDLKQQAGDIAEQAKAKAKETAHSGQTRAADQLEHLAQGVRRSADNFDDEQAWVRQGLSSAAASLERFSSTLRNRDLNELMHDAEDTARRHPVMFATACAVAGFALVRFLKSSGHADAGLGTSERETYGRSSDYGTSDAFRANSGRSTDQTAGI
jgi:hypothetical protein